jgi:hypothetical protein
MHRLGVAETDINVLVATFDIFDVARMLQNHRGSRKSCIQPTMLCTM